MCAPGGAVSLENILLFQSLSLVAFHFVVQFTSNQVNSAH